MSAGSVRGLPWVTDLFLHWRLACLVIWMTCGMWTGEQGGNGTSIQRSKFRKFHNLIVRKKFGALVVVHNLFSSIENLHTSSSKHVLALKDNTARFLRLFQLRNRRGAQILLFNASTLLVRRLVHLFRVSRGTLLEERGGGDLKGPSSATWFLAAFQVRPKTTN